MSDVRPLPLYPHNLNDYRPAGEGTDWNAWRAYLLRQAKAQLDVSFKVETSPAVPGGPVRVLAFGILPPFFCESVLIRPENVFNGEIVHKALDIYFNAPADHPAVISESEWLGMHMGGPVKYVGSEVFVPRKPGEPVIKMPDSKPQFR